MATVLSEVDLAKEARLSMPITTTLSPLGNEIASPKNEDLLVVSPYHEEPHLLDLKTLDTGNQLLAKALVGLKCLRSDYATAPYVDIFNWSEILDSVRQSAEESNYNWKEQFFYVVVFRSQIPPTTVYEDLTKLDKVAHAEATKSGGFLKYWFGMPDKDGRNLATCIWSSLHDARVGSVGPGHRAAAGAARRLYTEWKIERLRLLIKDNLKDLEIIDVGCQSLFPHHGTTDIGEFTILRICDNNPPLTLSFLQHTSYSYDSYFIMADASVKDLNSVQIEALVVMKIVKACSATFPTTATGSIVGMDTNGTLQITNSFPFPTADIAASESHPNDHMAASNIAAAAPRSKANAAYQSEMIKYLREVNVDANNVGWYTSANMGNFINASLIENQFHYQKEINERTVALVHDVSRSSQGALSLRAFRLSPTFMAAYKEGKFTTENMQKSKLTYKDVLVELPIIVHNSHLLTSFLHQLPAELPEKDLEFPASLSDLTKNPPPNPLYPNLESLDLSIDPYLERTCDMLLDSIETHYTELNNFQYFQRQLAREQTKVTAWKTKRVAENATRATQKLAPLPEDEWERLFKLPVEPSRLEGMLNARQVEQYSSQIDGFTASISSKMFAVKSNLLPESS